MIRWIIRVWRRRQRAIDAKILWPAVRMQTSPDRALAEKIFIQHMLMDPAYKDWPIEDMREYASELP